MKLPCRPYLEQRDLWPAEGRHIMAHYDTESVVVYQAYRPSIGKYAVQHQRFGGDWSYNRMSWIKPNFLWMMYRCGWAQKPGQEVVLAIRMQRAGLDQILAHAVHSSFNRHVYADRDVWKQRVASSSVRLQWDPDHDPHGGKCQRRAIQLGLRGETLRKFADDWCISIEDISDFVRAQYRHVVAGTLEHLQIPVERIYPVCYPADPGHLGVSGAHP